MNARTSANPNVVDQIYMHAPHISEHLVVVGVLYVDVCVLCFLLHMCCGVIFCQVRLLEMELSKEKRAKENCEIERQRLERDLKSCSTKVLQ
jgi:energy-converting hydrogenase Eha subunit C